MAHPKMPVPIDPEYTDQDDPSTLNQQLTGDNKY